MVAVICYYGFKEVAKVLKLYVVITNQDDGSVGNLLQMFYLTTMSASSISELRSKQLQFCEAESVHSLQVIEYAANLGD